MDTNSSTRIQLWLPSKDIEEETFIPKRSTESESELKDRKLPVVYYLSQNGQLQQPHVVEVPLSSPQGLYLRDVINRLNSVRGQGMATLYTWSCKRRYGNGFVWQDLSEYDLIDPCEGHDYVLKGSQKILETSSPSFRSSDTSPDSLKISTTGSSEGSNSPVMASDLDAYKAYNDRAKKAAHKISLREYLEADKLAELRNQMVENDCSSRMHDEGIYSPDAVDRRWWNKRKKWWIFTHLSL